MMRTTLFALPSMLLLSGCGSDGTQSNFHPTGDAPLFRDDLSFLTEHTDVLVLSDDAGEARVVLSPTLQGRVLTSTAQGDDGLSFGWINRELIASGERQQHINAFGGEDRFWLGPEGGQYSIYFAAGDPFDLAHWQVPEEFDWEPFDVVSQGQRSVVFRKNMHLTNYSGTEFHVRVDREVRLLDQAELLSRLGAGSASAVNAVVYESVNTITNVGTVPWTKEGGLLSIWILGMYNPSPTTTVVIPFNQGRASQLGEIVNDAYFGKVPEDRLLVGDGVLFFSGDGEYRSKIGLSPRRSRSVAGSYDASNRVLTLVEYNQPEGVEDYVNSMWEIQTDPYGGDVINSYNDGPPEPGAAPLGPFYELETSSPAAALVPGASITHVHRTIHVQGPEAALDELARASLGASLEAIKTALPRR
jgi:hypothetical protein